MAHTLIGTVTSEKRDKTITVSIVNRENHPANSLYKKFDMCLREYLPQTLRPQVLPNVFPFLPP